MTIPKITTDLAVGDPEATAKSRVISIVEGLLGANAFAGAAAPANWGGARAALNTAKALAGVAQDDIFNNERGSSARAKINALNAARWWMDDPHLLDAVAPSYFLGMKSQKHILAGKAAALASMLTVTNPSAIRRYFDENGVLQLAAPNTPRISWLFGWPRLLLEGAATNYVRNSALSGALVGVLGAGGALPTNMSLSAAVAGDLTTEVVATGTEKGMPYIDIRFTGQNTTTRFLNLEAGTGMPAVVGDKRAVSVWLRLISGSLSGLADLQFILSERSSSGTNATGTPASSTNIKDVIADASRRVFTRTMAAADCSFIQPYIRIPAASGPVDFTLRLSMPQCEAGDVATSPVLTNGTALTRTADLAALPASVGTLTAWALRGYVPTLSTFQILLGASGGGYIISGSSGAETALRLYGTSVSGVGFNAVLPGSVAFCAGWGASGRRVSSSGLAAVDDATVVDRDRATMYLGGAGGLVPGQVLYLDELVGWALPDRPTAAGAQAQARAA